MSMDTQTRLRLGVISPGDPEDPAAFSGAPRALMLALRDLEVEVVPLSGHFTDRWESPIVRAAAMARLRRGDLHALRAGVRRELPGAQLGATVQHLRQTRVALARRRAGRLDGAIMLGTGLVPAAGTRYVTYEDTTTAQARGSYAWSWLQGTRPSDHALHDRRAARVYGGAVACCSMSHWAVGSLVQDFAVAPARAHVAGVGPIRPTQRPAQRSWDTPRFLFVGFDWERKNGPAVVRAFSTVRERHPDATLDLVGGHPRLEIPGVTGHGVLGLDDRDSDDLLADLYARATCFVMPSQHEPVGQVYLEAANSGIPSIGTTSGGSATVIGDGGAVVDPADEGAILDAMLRFGNGPGARAAGERAHQHARLLTWPRVAERLIRALGLPAPQSRRFAEFL